jgi:hypothetical protein
MPPLAFLEDKPANESRIWGKNLILVLCVEKHQAELDRLTGDERSGRG